MPSADSDGRTDGTIVTARRRNADAPKLFLKIYLCDKHTVTCHARVYMAPQQCLASSCLSREQRRDGRFYTSATTTKRWQPLQEDQWHIHLNESLMRGTWFIHEMLNNNNHHNKRASTCYDNPGTVRRADSSVWTLSVTEDLHTHLRRILTDKCCLVMHTVHTADTDTTTSVALWCTLCTLQTLTQPTQQLHCQVSFIRYAWQPDTR